MLIEMKVKISTNGKFHVITVLEPILAANMTAELHNLCGPFLGQEVKNLLLNIKDIQKMDSAAADTLLELRNLFYANRASFVLCEPQPSIKKYFEQNEQFDHPADNPHTKRGIRHHFHGRNRKGTYGLVFNGRWTIR